MSTCPVHSISTHIFKDDLCWYCSSVVTNLMSTAGRGDMLRTFDLAHLCKVDSVPHVGPIKPTVLVKVEEKGKNMQVRSQNNSLDWCCTVLHVP